VDLRLEGQHCFARLVTGLDYQDPRLDPQQCSRHQTASLHADLLKAEDDSFGAKSAPLWRWWSLRRWAEMLDDCRRFSGLLNSARLKGIISRSSSGMLAAETAFEALVKSIRHPQLSQAYPAIETSWTRTNLPVRTSIKDLKRA